MDRIINCSHSLFLPSNEKETIYSINGKDQHILAHCMLTNSKIPDNLDSKIIEKNTKRYIDYVSNLSKFSRVELEKQLTKKYIHFILQGTPDAIIYNSKTFQLEIIDLKNGYQEVSPLTNQLKGYAALALDLFPWTRFIKLTIVQKEQIKSINIKRRDIRSMILLIDKVIKNQTYQLGDHCQYCPSKPHCKKLLEKYTTLNKEDYKSIRDLVRNKSIIIDMIEDTEKSLLTTYPDWFIPQIRKSKQWIDEELAPNEIKKMTPAKALSIDKITHQDNIKEIESISYKIKEESSI